MPLALRLFPVLLGLLSVRPSFAAEFWLRPDRFSATPGATLGAEIVTLGEPLQPAIPAVEQARVTLAGASVPVGLDPWTENQRPQRLSATFARPGWAVWSVDARPSIEKLAASELAARLHLLYASSALRERILRSGPSSEWRVSSRSTVKCIVTVGEPESADRSWRDASSAVWDLVPRAETPSFRVGQSAGFSVLAGTLPAIGTVVAVRSITSERELAAPVGADGSVNFVIPDPGLWLASASHVQISTSDDWLLEVRSVSLVFEVK
jgi:hypothetical protein